MTPTVIALAVTALIFAGPASPAAAVTATPATATAAAAAEDGFISSTPEGGETVAEAPSAVTLTFGGSFAAVEIEVTDFSGAVVSEGDAVVDGADVTQNLSPNLPAGDYTVTWRTLPSNSQPVSGDFHFFVADPTVASPGPNSGSQEVAAPPPPQPTAEPSPTPTEAVSEGYGGEVSGGGAFFPILLVASMALFLGVLLAAVLRLGQKRRARDARDGAARDSTDGA